MANGAFTLKGFESPEEVQARIGKVQQGALNTGGGFSGIEGAIYNAAAQGQAGIGKAIQTATGYEDPAVKKAKSRQLRMQNTDLTDMESVRQLALGFQEDNDTQASVWAADRYKSLKDSSDTLKAARAKALGSATKPTNSFRESTELVKMGYTKEVADAVSYNAIKEVKDDDGNVFLVNTLKDNSPLSDAEAKEYTDAAGKVGKLKPVVVGRKEQIRQEKQVESIGKFVEKTGISEARGALDMATSLIDEMKGVKGDGGKEGKGDIEGYGLWDSKLHDTLTSKKGVQLRQAVNNLFNVKLQQRSGAAVTINELNRLKAEFGAGMWNTESALISGLRQYKKLLSDYTRNVGSSFPKDARKLYESRSGMSFGVTDPLVYNPKTGKLEEK